MFVPHRLVFPFVVFVFLFLTAEVSSQNQLKLKPGAKGKICIDCHETFEKTLANPFVHTPVKSGECSECHNPHTASHGKLLAADPEKICSKCHEEILPEGYLSSHKVVVEGKCTKCHDPHGAKNKFNLKKAGNDLCFDCHKELGDSVGKATFKHPPVEKGCMNCHNPHASSSAETLLKKPVPSLCAGCHDIDRQIFAKQHMDYPVGKARCTSCHNPHGSNQKGILFDNVHKPFASKMCKQCHEEPASPTPLKTKKEGYELCKGCHATMINKIFTKNRVHWPLLDGRGCLNCHSPHASSQETLLKGTMTDFCGDCHKDTAKKQKNVLAKHPPVKEGKCTACHSPHASDSLFLLREESVLDVCGSCHEWQTHSTHPIGKEVTDPRNQNLTVECLSCHKSHGTNHKKMFLEATTTALCTGCHVDVKR